MNQHHCFKDDYPPELLKLAGKYWSLMAEFAKYPKGLELLRSMQQLFFAQVDSKPVSRATSDSYSPSVAYLLGQAEVAGLTFNPRMVARIISSHIDDVLFAIQAVEKKSQLERLKYPNAYFLKVLEDRRFKRENGQNAA